MPLRFAKGFAKGFKKKALRAPGAARRGGIVITYAAVAGAAAAVRARQAPRLLRRVRRAQAVPATVPARRQAQGHVRGVRRQRAVPRAVPHRGAGRGAQVPAVPTFISTRISYQHQTFILTRQRNRC